MHRRGIGHAGRGCAARATASFGLSPDAPRLPRMRTVTALALLLGLAALSGKAGAQTIPPSASGPFASVDLAGSPFIAGVKADAETYDFGRTFGFTAGYQLNPRLGVAFRVERAEPPRDPENVFFTGQTFVGVGAALARGSARAPLQIEGFAGASLEDKSDLYTLARVGPVYEQEFRGGRRVYELNATVSAVKYLPLTSGAVRISAGAGPFLEARHIRPRKETYKSDVSPETTIQSLSTTEWPLGVVLAVPVAVRLFGDVDLVAKAEARFDIAGFSIDDRWTSGHISIGLSL